MFNPIYLARLWHHSLSYKEDASNRLHFSVEAPLHFACCPCGQIEVLFHTSHLVQHRLLKEIPLQMYQLALRAFTMCLYHSPTVILGIRVRHSYILELL